MMHHFYCVAVTKKINNYKQKLDHCNKDKNIVIWSLMEFLLKTHQFVSQQTDLPLPCELQYLPNPILRESTVD